MHFSVNALLNGQEKSVTEKTRIEFTIIVGDNYNNNKKKTNKCKIRTRME